jgi:methanogenic corrinoid protein MtbC1
MLEFTLPTSALPLTVPYLQAVLANNSAEALRLAMQDGLASGVAPSDLHLRMILPAQREVGRLWQENAISVAQEHLATAITQLVMSHLYPHLPRVEPNGLSVLVACVAGELHDVGARMGADFLEMAGFEVRFLGANVPVDKLLASLREQLPHLLGLSATMHFHQPALRATVAAVREAYPQLPIAVGGGLLESSPRLADELGVLAYGESAEALADKCRKLLAPSGERPSP